MSPKYDCIVRGCPGKTDTTIIYHKVPSKPELKKKWFANLGLEDVRVKTYVCSRHFERKCMGRKKLIKNAVPTLFLGHSREPLYRNSYKKVPKKDCRRCCVESCRGGWRYFKLPKNTEQKEQWLRALSIQDNDQSSRIVVCDRHFSNICFGRKKLLCTALPTLNLTQATSTEKNPSFIARLSNYNEENPNCTEEMPSSVEEMPSSVEEISSSVEEAPNYTKDEEPSRCELSVCTEGEEEEDDMLSYIEELDSDTEVLASDAEVLTHKVEKSCNAEKLHRNCKERPSNADVLAATDIQIYDNANSNYLEAFVPLIEATNSNIASDETDTMLEGIHMFSVMEKNQKGFRQNMKPRNEFENDNIEENREVFRAFQCLLYQKDRKINELEQKIAALQKELTDLKQNFTTSSVKVSSANALMLCPAKTSRGADNERVLTQNVNYISARLIGFLNDHLGMCILSTSALHLRQHSNLFYSDIDMNVIENIQKLVKEMSEKTDLCRLPSRRSRYMRKWFRILQAIWLHS